MNTVNKSTLPVSRKASKSLVILTLAVAGGLFAAILGHKPGDQLSGPSPTVIALANSYGHLYNISDYEVAEPVWSPDGTMLAVKGAPLNKGDDAGPVTIMDVATGRKIRAFNAITATASLGCSPDSGILVATTYASTIYLLNVASGTVEHTLTIPVPPNFPTESPRTYQPLVGFSFSVDSFGWSSISHHLIVVADIGSWNGKREYDQMADMDGVGYLTIEEWDPDTGKLLRNTVLPRSPSLTSLSPDGDTLAVTEAKWLTATQNYATTWELWSVPQVAPIGRVDIDVEALPSNEIRSILWSPDSSHLVVVNGRALVVVDRFLGRCSRPCLRTCCRLIPPFHTFSHQEAYPQRLCPTGRPHSQ